ncbi:hypothetical protein GIB67_019572 [Kingdonia uniflora]|uniref:Uncharacterized protein n=1 Tax=Kingdonia uniflora TaxID=39325 RepID=A0A7J7N0V7_9MAGN|nr:hypothetical protein GIB67_019572 [Kingdonia uniflora]
MEKRIIPKCAVLEILISEGSLPRSAIVGSVFLISEKMFLEKFAMKYKKNVPQVVKTCSDLQRMFLLKEMIPREELLLSGSSATDYSVCNNLLHGIRSQAGTSQMVNIISSHYPVPPRFEAALA